MLYFDRMRGGRCPVASLTITRAGMVDLPAVSALYDAVTGHLAATVNYPGWKKGVYPNQETARQALEQNCLFAAWQERKLAGTVILNHFAEAGYGKVDWQVMLPESQVLIVHTLAVHPDCRGQGVASRLLEFALEYARQDGDRAVRLDVSRGNLPAISLYERFGFRHMDTLDLGYDPGGDDLFCLYQKLL